MYKTFSFIGPASLQPAATLSVQRMICSKNLGGPLRGLQCSQKHLGNLVIPFSSCRVLYAVGTPSLSQSAVFERSSGSSSSGRLDITCRAEPEGIGGYTPADYVTFSEDPDKQCHHTAEVVVDAPLEVCWSIWSDWGKLLDFLDLVGQIGLDGSNPDMALFQCFYRFRKLPVLEIIFLLEREIRSDTSIHFSSVYGMPIKGQLNLQEQVDGTTKVRLYFTHPVPNVLTQLRIGPFGLETDIMQILKENMAAFKLQVEALAPADWQQQKQQVADRVKQQQQQEQQEQQQQAAEQPQQQQAAAAAGPPPQPQQQQEAAVPAAVPAAMPGDRRKRSTASKSAAAQTGLDAAAAAGSRGKTRSRTASKASSPSQPAAEAAADSSSTRPARRRSRTSTASAAADSSSNNGAGRPEGGSSSSSSRRTTARRSSRRTAAGE